MPFHVGPIELVIVMVIVTMIFGVGKLPQAGEAMGKALREFRHAQSGDDSSKQHLLPGQPKGHGDSD